MDIVQQASNYKQLKKGANEGENPERSTPPCAKAAAAAAACPHQQTSSKPQ